MGNANRQVDCGRSSPGQGIAVRSKNETANAPSPPLDGSAAAVFAAPHQLDITRDARRHVALGGGVHHFLGAALARMEGQIALSALLLRFARIELAAPPTRLPTFTLHSLDSLPVALD